MILLYGTDSYRLRQALTASLDEARSRGPVLVDFIDGSAPDASDALATAGSSQGLFGDRRVLVISDVVLAPDLKDVLRQAGTEMDIIGVQDVTRLDAAGKRRVNTVTKLATAHTAYDALQPRERLIWIAAFCKERGRHITPTAAAELHRRAGADTWALALELEKLCAYAESDIDDAAVRTLVANPTELDEWELSNALSARDKRGALTALWRRLRSGAPEQALVGLVASATRTLLTVQDGLQRGLSASAIATGAGLHPFVVSKALKGAREADGGALREAHLRIACLDRDSKRGRADLLDGLFGAILGMR
ncbi:MAG TPA: hypothetical protein VIL33_05060 [Rhodothermia bacterium]